jgi:hypothetical protein
MHNFWIDLDRDIKSDILRNAVSYGWLRKEDIDYAVDEKRRKGTSKHEERVRTKKG